MNQGFLKRKKTGYSAIDKTGQRVKKTDIIPPGFI